MNTEPKSYIDVVRDWQNYLEANPNNFLRIKDLNTHHWLEYKENQGDPKTYLSWTTVRSSSHEGLVGFLDELIGSRGLKVVYIQFKRTNGSSSVHDKDRMAEKFDLSQRNLGIQNGQHAQQVQQQRYPVPTAAPQPGPVQAHGHQANGYESSVMQHMGGLGAAGLAAGLGYRELVTLEKKAEMSDHYKAEMDRFRKDNDILVIENRELQSKVNNATREKELAVKETQLATRSWMDSENLKALIENMGPVVQGMLAKGQAGGAQQLGMGAAGGLSEGKQRLIEYICDPGVDDDKVAILENALAAMYQRPDFGKKLMEMVQNEMSNAAAGS